MVIPTETHFTLGRLGSQQVVLPFDGERVVTDTGLLAVRALEKPLRVLADLAERLPDPRSRKYVRHSAQALLTQEVYQILAGYPDCNDAGPLRPDPCSRSWPTWPPTRITPWPPVPPWPASSTPLPAGRPSGPPTSGRSGRRSTAPRRSG